MKAQRILLKLACLTALLITSLAMVSPAPTYAAGPTIIVDTSWPTATGCGSYTGKPVVNGLTATINAAVSGQTILVCPGDYWNNGNGLINIVNKSKITIKAAVNDLNSRPVLHPDNSIGTGININNSTGITIDGLIIDGTSNAVLGYVGILGQGSSITIRNTGIIDPSGPSVIGLYLFGFVNEKTQPVTIENIYVAGYSAYGLYLDSCLKFSVKSSQFDASDGGRVDNSASTGIHVQSLFGGLASGTLSGNRILNNQTGIRIANSSKVSVTNNTLVFNFTGVEVDAGTGSPNADSNKIAGNTILEIPSTGTGILLNDTDAQNVSINKTTISGNIISSAQYTASGTQPRGIRVTANQLALAMVTATISKNTFLGIPPGYQIVNDNGYALLKYTGNQSMP